MKRLTILLIVWGLFTQPAWAYHTAIIGGLRDGLALGMLVEQHLIGEKLTARYGLEGSTGDDFTFSGDNPFQLSGGLKFQLGKIGRGLPFWGTAGLILYSGNNPLTGFSLSFIIEEMFNTKPLFVEMGADLMPNYAHIQAQIGYRIIDDQSELLH